MSHNVCYNPKSLRPKSSAVFEDGRWTVAVGDLVYVHVYVSSGKCFWKHAEVCSLSSSSDSSLIELYIPCLCRRLLFDIALGAEIRRCFDAVLCDGKVVSVGDFVSEVDDMFKLNYKVVKIDGEKLLCRHVEPNSSVKYPAIWFHVHEVEKVEND